MPLTEPMKQPDEIDVMILNLLQADSSLSIKDIAAEVDLSFTPTYERVKRLEADGFIKKYVALIDPAKVGLGLLVYCNIVLKEQSKKALMDFEKSVSKLPQVIEVMSISGTYDYMLKIAVADIATYNYFVVNVLANIPYIGQYHSNFVLKEVKKETAYKVMWKED